MDAFTDQEKLEFVGNLLKRVMFDAEAKNLGKRAKVLARKPIGDYTPDENNFISFYMPTLTDRIREIMKGL